MNVSASIRPPAVAGLFYPGSAEVLRDELASRLARAGQRPACSDGPRPKLLVVPHAGYVYSGDIAASAYARLQPYAAGIRRVVLLGPVHRVPVRGLAIPRAQTFETPLGRVAVDVDGCRAIANLPQVQADDRPHAQEHALEVQLPFLQTVLPAGFTLLPLAVGDATPGEVAQVIDRLWGGDETLIVISTDLSHYQAYDPAQAADRRTIERILAWSTDIHPHEACGARVLNGALQSARQHGLRPTLLDLRNSGDTAGSRDRVVGYAAMVFAAPDEMPGDVTDPAGDEALRTALLARARNAIRIDLDLPPENEPPHLSLQQPGAAFVTLHDAQGALRGCIGHLEPRMSLEASVRHNAAAAAFRDPRFVPLRANEWPGLQVEVSVLGAAEALLPAASEAEALARLVPGQDGVILEWQHHRATFLPQVWEQLPEPAAFLAALKHKAGLPADFWSPEVRLSRYRVRSFT